MDALLALDDDAIGCVEAVAVATSSLFGTQLHFE